MEIIIQGLVVLLTPTLTKFLRRLHGRDGAWAALTVLLVSVAGAVLAAGITGGFAVGWWRNVGVMFMAAVLLHEALQKRVPGATPADLAKLDSHD
jgi:uncharacterized membrane protein YhaH (DUF805 family)